MKFIVPFVVLLGLLGAVVAIDRPAGDADVVVINSNDAFTLDPQRMSYLHDFRLGYALYEGLVRWDNETFEIEPAVARSWRVSADGRTYTFELRDDVKWSNGEPVTAHDFVYSMRRLLLPETAADYSSLLFMIDGSQAFFRWRSDQTDAFARNPDGADPQSLWNAALERFDETVGVRALDDRTVAFRLERPVPYFLDLLCFAVCSPVHRPTVEGWQVDEGTRRRMREVGWHDVDAPPFARCTFVSLNARTGKLEQDHEWARPGRLVCNGPYILKRWRYKRDLLLERNEHYWRPEIMRNDSVLILTIEDANTRVLSFESGTGDWLTSVDAEYQADMLAQRRRYMQRYATEMATMRADGLSMDQALAALPEPQPGERRDIHPIPAFGIDFYSFNCRPALADGRANPFADARVRRAFVQATNRQRIVEDVTRLNEPVMTSLIPPGSIPGYEPPHGLSFDPGAARNALRGAGWYDRNDDGLIEDQSGKAFPTIDLLYTTSAPRYKWISLELKNQWERVLGVQVELRGVDTKFYKEDLKQGNFMVARGRWYGDYGDPTTFLDLNRCFDGNNDRGFCNDRIEALLDAAAGETDLQERYRLLAECERIIVQEQTPMLVLCQLVDLYMYDPTELAGISRHPRLTQFYWKLHTNADEPQRH